MTTYPSTSARSALAASATDRAPGFLLRAPLFAPRPPAAGAAAPFRGVGAPFASPAAAGFGALALRAGFTSFAGCTLFDGLASFAVLAFFGGFASVAGFSRFGGAASFAVLAPFAGFPVRLEAWGFGGATPAGDREVLEAFSAFAPAADLPAFDGFPSFAGAGTLPALDGFLPVRDAPAAVCRAVERGGDGRGDAGRADVAVAVLPGFRARFEPAATCPVAPFNSADLSGRAAAAAVVFRRVETGRDAASFFPVSLRAAPDRDAVVPPAVVPRSAVVVRLVDAAVRPAREASRRVLSLPRDPPADRGPAPRLPLVSGFPDF
ncbi:MAG: hypothetical protein KF817_01180 [Phycisphaeraceae bacterium]|nr:hypothetical protein [Phycisphaeraceae bacterium]